MLEFSHNVLAVRLMPIKDTAQAPLLETFYHVLFHRFSRKPVA